MESYRAAHQKSRNHDIGEWRLDRSVLQENTKEKFIHFCHLHREFAEKRNRNRCRIV